MMSKAVIKRPSISSKSYADAIAETQILRNLFPILVLPLSIFI